jgi:O-antigen/teichoic acid export membrane protein
MTGTAESRAGLGRLLGGVMWNAAGRGLPLLLALLLTPFLVHALGLERWGLFTLALALVGVFGIFDLGLGPALTRAVSERLGTGRATEVPALVGAALTALAAFSAVMAVLAALAMPVITDHLLRIPEGLRDESVMALRVLVLAAPLVVVNGALWGVLAAYQRFRAANLVSIPVSIFYYLGPVLMLLVWDSLVGVMLTLVACRLANTLSYAWLVRRELRGMRLGRVDPALVGPLLRMGGWMTLSGTLTQALLYVDRFLIGALLSLSAVAFYATPLDLVLRMWILPVAVSQALMPALASTHAGLPVQTASLLRRGALLIMLIVFPACLLLVAGAEEILGLWLGAEFAEGGGMVLRLLGVGIFFSCTAYAPGALLDAIGRPDVTARLSLAQAALFLPLSAGMLLWQGIEGAALAWALRAAADCAARLYFAARLYPAAREAVRGLAPALIVAGLGLSALVPLEAVPLLAGCGLLALACFAAAALLALAPEERALLRRPSGLRELLRAEGGR